MEYRLINAEKATHITGLSKSVCYKIIQKINQRLQKAGYITVRGWCSEQAFLNAIGYNANYIGQYDTAIEDIMEQ